MSDKLKKLLAQLVKLYPKYIDLSLERLENLLIKLDNPEKKLSNIIHIAGTNGKGSTLSYIKQILIENNYKVHCYTSPHLKTINERFVIANEQISDKELFKVINFIKKINNNNPITFFEIITAAAFYLFSQKKSDFTLIETGLGGRLDATNVIKNPILNIITPISIDHQEFLGNKLTDITKEKLGIIKPSSTIIIGKQTNFINNYIKKKIYKFNNKKIFYNQNYKIAKINKKSFDIIINNKKFNFNKPTLNGLHQIENAATAISAILEIKKIGNKINIESINKGLTKTKWNCRLEKGYLKKIPVFLDGAHNVEGAKQIKNFFVNNNKNRWLIIGMLKNKDVKNYLLNLKSTIRGIIALKIPGEKNSFSTKEILNICKQIDIECIAKKNINDANNYLFNEIKPDEIIISGSLYLVGKIRNLYI